MIVKQATVGAKFDDFLRLKSSPVQSATLHEKHDEIEFSCNCGIEGEDLMREYNNMKYGS